MQVLEHRRKQYERRLGYYTSVGGGVNGYLKESSLAYFFVSLFADWRERTRRFQDGETDQGDRVSVEVRESGRTDFKTGWFDI